MGLFNNFTTCKKCGATIYKGAKNCPNCGAPQSMGCGTAIVVAFIIMVGFNLIAGNKSSKTPAQTADTAPTVEMVAPADTAPLVETPDDVAAAGEEYVKEIETMLSNTSFPWYDVKYNREYNGYDIYVTVDGISLSYAGKINGQVSDKDWQELITPLQLASQIIQEDAEKHGVTGARVALSVMNDKDTSLTLLLIVDGEVVFDYSNLEG